MNEWQRTEGVIKKTGYSIDIKDENELEFEEERNYRIIPYVVASVFIVALMFTLAISYILFR